MDGGTDCEIVPGIEGGIMSMNGKTTELLSREECIRKIRAAVLCLSGMDNKGLEEVLEALYPDSGYNYAITDPEPERTSLHDLCDPA